MPKTIKYTLVKTDTSFIAQKFSRYVRFPTACMSLDKYNYSK